MRNKLFQQILDETPLETKIFVEKYGDLVVRINELLKEKSLSQKDFAERMEQKPSAVSRWLSGTGNLTLRTIAKMEAELGVDLIQIPQTVTATEEKEWTVFKKSIKGFKKSMGVQDKGMRSSVKTISIPYQNRSASQQELFVESDATKYRIA